MSDFLTYEQDGAVVTLTMNQPEARNPLSGESQYWPFWTQRTGSRAMTASNASS
jgi:hypothetical protein